MAASLPGNTRREKLQGGRMRIVFILGMLNFRGTRISRRRLGLELRRGRWESQADYLKPLEQVNIEQIDDLEREEEDEARVRVPAGVCVR